MTPRWALFISGRGSTAQALLDLLEELDIRLVVSSKEPIWGQQRAKRLGIPIIILESKINWDHLTEQLLSRRISQIFLLGFMKLLPEKFVNQWQGKITNVHPSLLPKFAGMAALEKSYAAKDSLGVTIHDVNAHMDAGKILLQKKTLLAPWPKSLNFEYAQNLISLDEQRLVRVSAQRRQSWNPF